MENIIKVMDTILNYDLNEFTSRDLFRLYSNKYDGLRYNNMYKYVDRLYNAGYINIKSENPYIFTITKPNKKKLEIIRSFFML